MGKAVSKTLTTHASAGAVTTPLRVLMVEDRPIDVELCALELNKAGFEAQVDRVDSRQQFDEQLAANEYDVVLSDYGIPGWSGLDAFHALKQTGKDIPFILVTGTLGEGAAVAMMKEGVSDYILKDRLVRLPVAIQGAFADRESREARRRAEEKYHRLAQAVESSSELIAMEDREGKITFANQAFLQALGYTEEELLGRFFTMGAFLEQSGGIGRRDPIGDSTEGRLGR
jgi:DNA-binding NtrC family response regulator